MQVHGAAQYRRFLMTTSSGRVRAFVALDLPEPAREALAVHVAACARVAPGMRWIEPDSMHLTLRFLGNLEPDVLERVRQVLPGVEANPFRMAMGGHGLFGPRQRPRVVWLGITQGKEACAALAARTESACVAAGMVPESRPFQAHVSLARARGDGEPLPALPEPPALEPWVATEFVLFESRLGRQPRYVALERYPLVRGAA
jgi:2'-5' RNA ligase